MKMTRPVPVNNIINLLAGHLPGLAGAAAEQGGHAGTDVH
jgi:hypothetical protein